jgi:5-methylthioribose kinase
VHARDEEEPADPRLNESQLTRIDLARRDLGDAHTADLATMDAASLVLLITRLRRSLDDALALIGEITAQEHGV